VTSASDSAARNFGLERQHDHASRYERAEEYLEVCYKLWEGSWDDNALVRDVERGVYVEPSRVHRIDHRGIHFSVDGPHLVEPSPQRAPLLYQAGVSTCGRALASRHAECVFVGAPSKPVLERTVQNLRVASPMPDATR
jgi:alkanesulfonate monooxygenase SsuD/methylene tetrahydromethanopterin reductase-like flavin-dependent oxidoreductase (luciferase family)